MEATLPKHAQLNRWSLAMIPMSSPVSEVGESSNQLITWSVPLATTHPTSSESHVINMNSGEAERFRLPRDHRRRSSLPSSQGIIRRVRCQKPGPETRCLLPVVLVHSGNHNKTPSSSGWLINHRLWVTVLGAEKSEMEAQADLASVGGSLCPRVVRLGGSAVNMACPSETHAEAWFSV